MDAGAIRNSGANAAPGREPGARRDAVADPEVRRALQELRNRDREVRAHEQAHASVAGAHASSPSYTLELGPDSRAYAAGGEVRLHTLPVQGDPAATVDKMEQVARAALAPAEPSPQDMAAAQDARARAESGAEGAAGAARAFAEVDAMTGAELLRRGGRLDLFV